MTLTPTHLRSGGAVALMFIGLIASGCNHCEKLEEKICADLGEDCEIWKTDMNKSGIPTGGKKPNNVCKMQMADAVYPNLIKGLRGGIEALKKSKEKAKAAEAKAAK